MLAALPLVVVISKLLGLYDRDELVLRKSTLEEAPRLFQLATLFSLVLWIAEQPLDLGELGGDQVAGAVGDAVRLPDRRPRGRPRLRPARPRRPSAACCSATPTPACARAARSTDSSTVNAEVVAEITSVRIGEAEVPLAHAGRSWPPSTRSSA